MSGIDGRGRWGNGEREQIQSYRMLFLFGVSLSWTGYDSTNRYDLHDVTLLGL